MTPPRASGTLSLGLANALSLLAAVGAAAAYARWLVPTEFAHWTAALAIARACLLLLDGGLKTALVRRAAWPDPRTLRHLQRLCLVLAAALVIAGGVSAWWFWSAGRLQAGEAILYAAYLAAYLLPYPPLFGALARLERAQSFGAVGRAEGLSVALEFSLPAAAMALGLPYWLAFAIAVCAARIVRSGWIIVAARGVVGEVAQGASGSPAALLREGAGVQAIAALSMVRDQMHLWLVAPWFGASWAGMYGFALTACALASQAFVQTAARVALPALRHADRDEQWPMVLLQVRRLAAVVLPALALLPAWLARADAQLWDGRWHEAIALVPWFCLRMVAGVATTSLGAWLLVSRTPWAAARTHAAWTSIEVAVAVCGLLLFGPQGLAIGSAASAWAGVLLFLASASPRSAVAARWRVLVPALLAHRAIWLALGLALWVQVQPGALPWATLALPLAWWRRPAPTPDSPAGTRSHA
jgi:O-antigen/teichoic acid export membrane protein